MTTEDLFPVGAYQILKFHPSREYEIDEFNSYRICLIFKYLKSIPICSEFVTTLLHKNLKEYVEKIKRTKETTVINRDDIFKEVKFQSGLNARENGVMEFVKVWPCQTVQWNYCKSRFSNYPSNRDITSVFNFDKETCKKKETIITETNIKLCEKNEKHKRFKNFNRKCENNSEMGVIVPKEGYKNDHIKLFQSAKIIKQANENTNKMKRKKSTNNQFVCPLNRDNRAHDNENDSAFKENNDNLLDDERLKNIDEKMIELIKNEIMDGGATVKWDDVAGLTEAKEIIKEIVVLPMLRPDIFTGLRRPPKGILLFGPPGTGKTLIGKCIASQSKSTFFSISASSLTSKWVGEGEKMVRALFAVARVHQPSVVFIDEIDSLLTQRSETEHESSRRIKTEFLVQLDGATTGEEDRILVIGATNRPQELDEAARRRFVKRLYIPLPDEDARKQIIQNLLGNERNNLTQDNINDIAKLTQHYSGADMANLCKEASMGPIRSIPFHQLESIHKNDVRCVTLEDFHQALTSVRPSVSQSDLGLYIKWDQTYGSGMKHATN